MTCGSCAARVEGALQAVDGVGASRVNLATETASVIATPAGVDPADLLAAVREAGYEAESVEVGAALELDRGRDQQLVGQRGVLAQAIGLALPVVGLQHLAPLLFAGPAGGRPWWSIVQAVICTALLCLRPGRQILGGGLRAARHRSPNMDLLVSIGVAVAFVSSLVALVAGTGTYYFEAAALIVAFITLGRYFETRARREASGAVAALARRLPQTATRLHDGQPETVPVSDIRVGDHVRVAQDTLVPVDGRVLTGSAAVDESAITGESVPRSRGPGDPVRAGGVVREGMITVEATAVGEASAVGRILRAVEDAQAGKTRMQRIADRVAGVFVPIVIALALATFIGWVVAGWIDPGQDGAGIGWALRCAVAVLVIACPCAMGLATPTAVLVATGTAAGRGILVRDAAALEAAGQVNVILLDKTGTLTAGQAQVQEVWDEPVGPITTEAGAVLEWAASAEQFSQHPLARAIVAKARESNLKLRDVGEFANEPGLGVRATIDGHEVLVGSRALLAQHEVDFSTVQARADQMSADGQTVTLLAIDGVCAGVIGLLDTPRPGASRAVDHLTRLGIEPVMITGDQAATATAVAASVGIEEVHAEMLPESKLAQVRRRQEAGQRVAFVGDGINDAPALTGADVGIAFATGTDVAVESADITLLRDDLSLVAEAIELARRSVRIMKENLFWAFFYNMVAIPLAAFGVVRPGLAAAAMMASSISVVLNSLRLREKEGQNGKTAERQENAQASAQSAGAAGGQR